MLIRTAMPALLFAGLCASAASAQTCLPTNVTLQTATASYTQTCGATFLPRFTIDGTTTTSWALGRCSGGGDLSLPESLVFETQSDLAATTTPIKLTFKIHSGGFFPGNPSSNLTLGHFAISYTTSPRADFADGASASTQLGTNWTRLTPTTATARWADGNGNPLPPNNQDPILTVQSNGSILASGPDPEYAIYTLEVTVNNVTITGFKFDMIDENGSNTATVNGLPTGGPGRHGNGNCFIRELAIGYNRVPTITAQPQGGSICGTTTPSQTLVVGVDGEGPFSYQWRRNSSPITNATGSTYVATTAGSYDVVVTAPCSTQTSQAAVITNNAASIETHPVGGDLCAANGSLALFVVGRGQEPLSYQWKKDGVDIPGATSSAFTATARTGGGGYSVKITNACGEATSNTANVVGNNPVLTTQPTGGDLCAAGGNLVLNVAAGGAGPFTYQWQKGGTDIAGATNASYTVTAADGPGSYKALVMTNCGSTLSQEALVTGGAAPSITTQPTGGNLCSSNGTLTLTVVAAGDGLAYQWRHDGADVAGATSASYTVSTPNFGSYDVRITGTCGTVTSDAVTVSGALCVADFNCDAFVDFFDYEDFVTAFQAGAMTADCNGDQFIDFFDYECFVEVFMQGC